MKTITHNPFARLSAMAGLVTMCLFAMRGTAVADTDLGTLGSISVSADALLYQETDRYRFSTTMTGDSDSGIALAFLTTGGGGYNIDLYSNGYHIGSTAGYSSTYFTGYRYQVDSTTAWAVLPLAGLPAGTYTFIVSRSSLTGTNSAYQMALLFPGGGGGGTGGGGTGGGFGGGKPAPAKPNPGGSAPKDTWSAYYSYAGTLYNYYVSSGQSDLGNAYYYLYYGYGEYNRYKAAGNTKRAAASYWWFYASFAYFYYTQYGDNASANTAYNEYVALAQQYR